MKDFIDLLTSIGQSMTAVLVLVGGISFFVIMMDKFVVFRIVVCGALGGLVLSAVLLFLF